MTTKVLDRIMDGARTPEGKVIAVLLALCLSLMSWNVAALSYAMGNDGAVAGEQEAAEQQEALTEEAPEPEPAAQADEAAEPEPAIDETAADAAADADADAAADTAASVEVTEVAEPETEPAADGDKAVKYPAVTLAAVAGGTRVTLSAPEGSLPEGVTIKARDVTSDRVAQQVETATGEELNDFQAIDITLYDIDGNEVQPLKPVNVTFSGADLESDDVSVYHIDDDGAVDEINPIKADADVQSFKADSFSVYVIDASVPTATYEFYNGENLVDTQKVRDGNVLHAPATPEYGEGMQFLGWYDNNDQKLEFDASGQLIANVTETATYAYTAKIVTSITVTFYDQGANPAVLAVKQVDASEEVSTDDVVITPASVSEAFIGWAADQDADEAIYAAGESITGIAESLSLYPVIKSAHWITFNENDNDNLDSNATYIAPVFVLSGEQPVAPADPVRPGYVFTGWYTDQACSDGAKFDFGGELTGDITLYAGWQPSDTTYTVVFWKQKITDKKEVTDYTKKSYDYEASLTVEAETGSDISVPSKYMGYDGLASVEIGENAYDFTGFKYSHCSEGATVAGDGGTVLNVYYDRKLMTIELYPNKKDVGVWEAVSAPSQPVSSYNTPKTTQYYYQTSSGTYGKLIWVESSSGKWVLSTSSSGKKYTGTYYRSAGTSSVGSGTPIVMTGLYGQTLADNGYRWPSDRYTDITFLDAFQGSWFDDNEDNTLFSTFKTTGGSDTTVNHYKENKDGTWPSTPTNSTKESNSAGTFRFLFTAKYNGYTVKEYRINENAWKDAEEGARSDTVAKGSTLDIRYALNDYNIDFRNDAQSAGTKSYAYGKSLKGVGDWTPECPYSDSEQYTFVGWFADPECAVYVFFGEEDAAKKEELIKNEQASEFTTIETMPAGNFAVYAKWEKTWYNVKLDSNGGEFADGQSPSFWLQYGDTVNNGKPFRSAQITRDGYTLAGWQIASGAAGEQNYNDKAGAPWNFASGVQGNLNLKAVWKGDINTFKLQYKVNDVVTQDNHDYAAGAQAPVNGPSVTAPTGKVFLGWRVASDADKDSADQATSPNGGLITLSEDISDEDGVVTLVPAFGDSAIATTSIMFYANYPDGSAGNKASAPIENNGSFTLPTASKLGFEPEGYSFRGWTTVQDATYSEGATGSYAAGTLVGVDTENEPNKLYAQWELNTYTITWKDKDGTVLETDESVPHGTTPTYDGATPAKTAEKANVSYVFIGWDKEIAPVTEDADYTAKYAKVTGFNVTYDAQEHTVTVADAGDLPVTYGDDGATSFAIKDVADKVDALKVKVGDYETTVPAVINPKAVTVTANNVTKVYDGEDAELAGATVSGTLDGEQSAVYSQPRFDEGTDLVSAGERPGVIGFDREDGVQGNYDVTYVAGDLTITQATAAEVRVSVSIAGWTYGDAANAPVPSVQGANDYAAPTYEYKARGAEDSAYAADAPTQAGDYTVRATWAGTDNTAGQSATADFSIAPKAATVTVQDASKTYGNADPELTATVTGNINGDEIAYTLSRDEGEDFGTYAITATPGLQAQAEGDEVVVQGNYAVTYVPATFTIDKRPVTLTSANDGKVYDGTALTSTEIAVGGDGWVTGEGAAYTVTGSQTWVGSSENAFTYALNQNTKAENYLITTVPGTLTVTDEGIDNSLLVSKTHDENTVYDLGDVVTFDITATNIYDRPMNISFAELPGVTLAQDAFAGVAAGTTVSTTAAYTITEADVADGSFVNTVTATFTDPTTGEQVVAPTGSDEVDEIAGQEYALSITKEMTSTQATYNVGDTITYRIAVTNTGNQSQDNVVVTDQLQNAAGTVAFTGLPEGATADGNQVILGTLAPRETVTIDAAYTVQREDAGASIANTAVASNPDVPGNPGDTAVTVDSATVESLYALTFNYVYADGSQAAPSTTATYLAGEEWTEAFPAIDGYASSVNGVAASSLTGTMRAADDAYTVVYTAIPAAVAAVIPPAAAGPVAPVAAAVPAAAAAVAPPAAAVTIDDDGNPLVESIDDDENALASGLEGEGEGGWALIDVLATILTAILAIVMLVGMFGRKQDEDEYGNETAYKRHRMLRIASIVPAAVAIVALLLTQDFSQPMVMVDAWTVLFAIIAAVNVILTIATRVNSEDADNDNTPTPAMA